ncbi:MAG: hypothetical protein VZR00_07485 [Lachnospiraceae bacterium]|nr:hypothetical protein [Lachnospiraceae bacterium]
MELGVLHIMKVHLYISNFRGHTFREILKIVLFLAGLLFLIIGLTIFLRSKYPFDIRQPFYDTAEEADYDVLMMGTSHTFCALQPMQLYEDYGISSYCLATGGERIEATYYSLADAFDHSSPKLVVLDLYSMGYWDDENYPVKQEDLHSIIDPMPLGDVRTAAVNDLVEESRKIEYRFPLSIYHGRWHSLTESDFHDTVFHKEQLGAQLCNGRSAAVPPTLVAKNAHADYDSNATRYLKKILELCQENNAEILLVLIPYNANETFQLAANQGGVIASAFPNARYENLLYRNGEICIDYSIDCADEGSHLNPSGARKVTSWLGRYIRSHYELPDCRDERTANYDFWQEAYIRYLGYKDNQIRNIQTCQLNNNDSKKQEVVPDIRLYCLLAWLNDKDYSVRMWIDPDSSRLKDKVFITYCKEIFGKEFPEGFFQGERQIKYGTGTYADGNFDDVGMVGYSLRFSVDNNVTGQHVCDLNY